MSKDSEVHIWFALLGLKSDVKMEADAGGPGKCIWTGKNCIYALMSSIKGLLEEISNQHAACLPTAAAS